MSQQSAAIRESGDTESQEVKCALRCPVYGNFVQDSAPGCFVVHDTHENDRVVGVDLFRPDEFGLKGKGEEAIPDISIDPSSGLLTCINKSTSHRRSIFISVRSPVYDAKKREIEAGLYRDAEGNVRKCTTLIVVIGPRVCIDVCYIYSDENLQLYSDVTDIPSSSETLSKSLQLKGQNSCSTPCHYVFPLRGTGPFLCTQGVCGSFTHFYPGTYHAIDFQCPIGTPVVAIADGIVVEVSDTNVVSGIHASNLYVWNSLMIRLLDGNFVEYVHIKTHSSLVKTGEPVKVGQHICDSGDIGFCPKPHLHIQLHESNNKDAPTIPLEFLSLVSTAGLSAPNSFGQDHINFVEVADKSPGKTFLPQAGIYYNEYGKVF
jgi:hypothetical protein